MNDVLVEGRVCDNMVYQQSYNLCYMLESQSCFFILRAARKVEFNINIGFCCLYQHTFVFNIFSVFLICEENNMSLVTTLYFSF
jgi:hypothetical protein